MPTKTSKINKVLKNPADNFSSPQEIVQKKDLTVEQKIEILRRWEYDELEMAVAEEENMAGGPPSKLEEILAALRQLKAGHDSEHTPPTKQGGL